MSGHPWFAAIVTLWFAALLALSSLSLAPAMLERIVGASRIDTFIAAAAPPLGQTARLLVALGLAGLGGVLGLVLGRLLAVRAKVTQPGAREAVYAASEERNGDEAGTWGKDEAGLGLRDRLARLTGQGDGPRDFADLPRLRARDRHPDAPGRKPLTPSDDLAADDVRADDLAADDHTPVEPVYAPATEDVVMVAQDVPASNEPLELTLVDVERPRSPLDCADQVPAAPVLAGARLDSLGVVQLTERLAIAMRARRERDARRRQAVAPAPDEAAVAAPILLPSLIAVRPREPALAPAALPEVSAARDDAKLDSAKLDSTKLGSTKLDGAKLDSAKLDRDALEGGYSSLLDLSRRPAHSDAMKAGEPVAGFAGAADGPPLPAPSRFPPASDPAENYRALKAALDSIQRISGTR